MALRPRLWPRVPWTRGSELELRCGTKAVNSRTGGSVTARYAPPDRLDSRFTEGLAADFTGRMRGGAVGGKVYGLEWELRHALSAAASVGRERVRDHLVTSVGAYDLKTLRLDRREVIALRHERDIMAR